MKTTLTAAIAAALWISGNVGRCDDFRTGSATRPEIEVIHPKFENLIDGVSVVHSGRVKPGTTGRTEIYIIRNTGSAPLRGLAITKSGANKRDFSVTQPSPVIVAPGKSARFTVLFKPARKGRKTAMISIANNDVGENPFDIKLTGVGRNRK